MLNQGRWNSPIIADWEKQAQGRLTASLKDSKRRMHFSIVRFVDRDDGVEVLRGFFVVTLAKQVYIMCLRVTGGVPPTGRGCLYIGIPH